MKTLILSGRYAEPVTDTDALAASLCCGTVYAEELTEALLVDCGLLINTLGNKYFEDTLPLLLGFIRRGGSMIFLAPMPFTEPYSVSGGKAVFAPPCNDALHELGFVDSVIDDGPCDSPLFTETLSRFSALAEWLRAARITRLYSPVYHLSSSGIPFPGTYLFETPISDGELLLIADCSDGGHRRAAPLAKLSLFGKGELYFVNFEAEDFRTSGVRLAELLAADCAKPCGCVTLSADRSLYLPGERVSLSVSAKLKSELPLDCSLAVGDKSFCFPSDSALFTRGFELDGLPEGLHNAHFEAKNGGELLFAADFGFYLLSRDGLRERLSRFSPLVIDRDVSPDYMLRDGVPFPMHGISVFCTDGMRSAISRLNVTQLKNDFDTLCGLGFNILRTGLWDGAAAFYNNDGSLNEMAKRNLAAFFLAASEAELTVQFVPDAFCFNLWDRTLSPLFDPTARARTVTAIRSFCETFKDFRNIQLDIINEPSYSLYNPWALASPCGDPHETEAWREFLRERYDGDISALRAAWGVTASAAPSFDTLEPPPGSCFLRDDKYDRKQAHNLRVSTRDFYDFADSVFAGWMRELKTAEEEAHGGIYFTLGRDEPTRVPTHQRGVAEGGYDFTAWHQWHRDSIILSEYLLCKVRGRVCCGQEIGVYPFYDYRYGERLGEADIARMLRRKLLYSFGNYIFWQAHSDPHMLPLCEPQLGVIRADGSETPALGFLRRLAQFEDTVAPLLTGRREPDDILLVFPESLHFSPDFPIAQDLFSRAAVTLHHRLHRQCNTALESLLSEENRDLIGKPKLIILTDCIRLREDGWRFLLGEVGDGATLLLCGDPDTDEYGRDRKRLAQVAAIPYTRRNSLSFERFRIGEAAYECDISNAINGYSPCKLFSSLDFGGDAVTVIPHGKGQLVYCSAPVCADTDGDAREALYAFAAELARLPEPPFYSDTGDSLLIYPMEYTAGTLYTVINEGAERTVCFTDTRSGSPHTLHLSAEGGAKLFVLPDGSEAASFND